MECFFNIIHFILYKINYRLFLIFNKINPVRLLYKLPAAKRRFEKKGYDPVELLSQMYRDPEVGVSTIFSGGILIAIMSFILVGIAHLICIPLRLDLYSINKIILAVIFFVPSYYISHILVFKDDKYIKYFKEFDKKSKAWKRRWALITLGCTIGSPIWGFVTLVLLYKFV